MGPQRLLHVGKVRRMTRELQGEVRLDRCVHLARPAIVNIPTAVRELAFQNMTSAPLLKRIIHFPKPVHEEDKIGAEGAVDEEFAAPMTIRVLLPEQIFLRPGNRLREIGRAHV